MTPEIYFCSGCGLQWDPDYYDDNARWPWCPMHPVCPGSVTPQGYDPTIELVGADSLDPPYRTPEGSGESDDL